MKIGVFDSGVGGLSFAQAISRAFPAHEVILRQDTEHVPYGVRRPAEILGFIVPILGELASLGCKIIVIACNTVSTTLLPELRQLFPDIELVGVEPMVKPAAGLTHTGIIAVCATPATLRSPRYAWLKQEYAAGIKVLEPDCSDWAYMIEHESVDEKKIAHRINQVLDAGADVIVLGCTHYHWIEREIRELAGDKAVVLQPEPAVIKLLAKRLASVS